MAPSSHSQIPKLYRLFFMYIEPVSALIGAYFAHFSQGEYMSLTAAAWGGGALDLAQGGSTLAALDSITVSRRESVVLSQLANLYLFFAINEACVLRATADRRVWAVLLAGLLVADLGHLWACREAAGVDDWSLFWRAWDWNRMYWGNIGFVYAGATMRVCFLLGVGLGKDKGKGKVV